MSRRIEAVVIGASAGGVEALKKIFSTFEKPLRVPIIVVLHIPAQGSVMVEVFGEKKLRIKEAEDKEILEDGAIYFAPPGYHLLAETDRSLSLSVEDPVLFSRPSIDVTFQSAAWVFGAKVLGVLLTGANSDGAQGLLEIHSRGGITIVQDPEEAYVPTMPQAALGLMKPTYVLKLEEIGHLLSVLEL